MKTKRTSNFKKLRDNTRKIDGKHAVSFSELFPDSFIAKNTSFADGQTMMDQAKISCGEDFQSSEWGQFIKDHSTFTSWEEMQKAAFAEYATARLFAGIK